MLDDRPQATLPLPASYPRHAPDAVPRSARLERATVAARQAVLSAQREDGHWCAELEGDSILASEYALALYFLGRSDEARFARAAAELRHRQLPSGGWSPYPGGPPEVSASAKAYLVLKLVGDDPAAPHMARARQTILDLGGLDACNSFTKLYLAIFGQYPWASCPAVPPEMILLPRWFYFNIYAMSSWSRAIVVPLSIIWARKPACSLPDHAQIPELRVGRSAPPQRNPGGRLWTAFFHTINALLQTAERLRLRPLRQRALDRAEQWILARLEQSDGLGAIFPPIINTLIALRSLGYASDHPVIRSQERELERLEIVEGERMRVQPCRSPVWDTALAALALVEAGLPAEHEALQAAGRWLMAKEVKVRGDWRVMNPHGPIGGWYFEYANAFYPDCDDTAEVLKVLARIRLPAAEDDQRRAVIARGLAWLRSMQNTDGGWAAFDKGCNREILTYIPFADHNAMIDPSTADITARTLEAFFSLGAAPQSSEVRRAVAFLWRLQEEDGTWYGRWGCNYLYGTWLGLCGLRSAGTAATHAGIQRAAAWLRSCQNEDGGWGELPASYDDPAQKGEGPSTASQTAWALLGLDAAGDHDSLIVHRGIDYLLRTQRDDGTWFDEPWTGTGFPQVFYLRYHLYATYFPLLALARHGMRMRSRQGD